VVEQNCAYQDIDNKDLDAYHLYIKFDNEIIAYTRLLAKGTSYDNCCSIGRVVVHKEHRNYQLGKKIMHASIDWIKNHWPNIPIKISAQQYLEKFYTDIGFETIGEAYLEDDIPHLPMVFKK
jgi:ElaA protein